VCPSCEELHVDYAIRSAGELAKAIRIAKANIAGPSAELDLLTSLDGRPPILLLDDVFSELDPDRRSHLVRRIAALPQAFVTTTTLDDLDPALLAIADTWRVDPAGGTTLSGPTRAARPVAEHGSRP